MVGEWGQLEPSFLRPSFQSTPERHVSDVKRLSIMLERLIAAHLPRESWISTVMRAEPPGFSVR